jgi:hypothetical protein
MKNCLTTLIGLKSYCKEKSHLNKVSEEASDSINSSFENTFHRTVCKLPLSIKPISTLIPLLDSIFDNEASHLVEKVNSFVIRLLSTIKLCNSLKPAVNEKVKGSSDGDESNSEKGSVGGEVLDAKTSDRLKTTIPYMIQILNKTMVNACYHLPLEQIKDSFSFYMISLFGTKQDSELSEHELVGFRHIALKGLNGIFATSIRDNDTFKDKIALFSKYGFEESFVFLFSSVQKMFADPSITDSDNQHFTQAICENIKFVTNTYLCAEAEQKEVIIDTTIKILLGVLIGIQENKIQRNKPILAIINAVGDSLYNIIVNGDQALAKNYIATSLSDAQKHMLQNVIKAIAATKQTQDQQKAKTQNVKGARAVAGNPKFKENQSKIKLATKIGK